MDLAALRRLLERLADTADAEISCDECFELMSSHAELDAAGRTNERAFATLRQHLRQCGVCREEYEILRELVREGDADGLTHDRA